MFSGKENSPEFVLLILIFLVIGLMYLFFLVLTYFRLLRITKNNKTVASGIRRAAAMMIPKTPALAPTSGISGSFERSPGIITRPLVDSVTINPAKLSRRETRAPAIPQMR